MNSDYELLFEKEEVFARMIMQVLEDNDIPCAASPVYGAGLVSKTGMREWLRVYVPCEKREDASGLMQAFFSAECVAEENDEGSGA